MANDHYLTESLIKPWCDTKWKCTYYDDSTNKVERSQDIISTFARTNMIEKKIETAFNEKFEDSLLKLRQRLVRDNDNYSKILSGFNYENIHWKETRSLYIWFHLQCLRYEKYTHFIKGKNDSKLDDFMKNIEKYGEEFLNQFAQCIANEKIIILLKIPQPYTLFLPDTGYFLFPFPDKEHMGVYKFGIMLPFTTEYAFALCNKTTDVDYFLNSHEEMSLIPYFSTYNHNYKKMIKFIIPPQIIKNGSSDEEIIESFQDMRTRASLIFNDRKRVLECITEMRKIVGLNLHL